MNIVKTTPVKVNLNNNTEIVLEKTNKINPNPKIDKVLNKFFIKVDKK
jgi:hypothetical protein